MFWHSSTTPQGRQRKREAGVVLLIAIFVLMLVSVVAIALIVSSGTETALTANYRSSATVYYAASAGLEEGRGRLLSKNPDYFNNSPHATFIPNGGLTLDQVRYIGNPTAFTPTDSTSPLYDAEYGKEFGREITAVPDVQAVDSVSGVNLDGIPAASYNWVRVNAVTEKALNLDVDKDGNQDATTLLYYDPAHVDSFGNPRPGLIASPTPPPTASQALEITALASLPNGTQKLLQYVVAPDALNLQLPAPLVLDGINVSFTPPNSSQFFINGNDQYAVGACNPGATPVSAVAYTNSGDPSSSNITGAINAGFTSHYMGTGTTPSVNYVGPPSPPPVPFPLAPNLLTVGGLNALVKTITDNADVVINHDATQFDLPTGSMSPSNPMTIVVNGDLNTNAWHGTGYGLLLITGQFTYDPDTSWRGLVLVIGKGIFYSHQGGTGNFQGGMLIANLFDSGNNPLPTSGPPGIPSFTQTSGGAGLYYSSCWITASQPPLAYKVLSFRELPQ